MEAVGQLIVGLHRNLEEIRASLGTNGGSAHEQALLQSTIDRAEAQLRAQAREFVAAAQIQQAAAAAPPTGGQLAVAYGVNPQTQFSESRRLVGSPVPGLPRPPASRQPGSPQAPARLKGQRPLQQPAHGARVRAKTTNSGRILPKPNRLDPLSAPPALTEQDLEAGLYNLNQRGFIPPASDLTPAMERGMPVIMQRPAPLYDQSLKFERRNIAPADMASNVKLDLSQPVRFAQSAPDALVPMHQASLRCYSASPRTSARQLPPLNQQSAASLPALLALPAPPVQASTSGVTESFGTFCTELLDAGPSSFLTEPQELVPLSPLRVGQSQTQMKAKAATQISSHYKGLQQRRNFAKMQVRDSAARQLQRTWNSACIRMATKLELLRRQEEDRKQHTELMYQLGQDWFQLKQLRRVEVHICSMSIDESRRRGTENYQALQAAQISRIFRLMDPKKDMIFVAPKFLHEDILDYYAKIMQFRGVKNPPGRFQIVVPENAALTPHISLTQALLCSPKALKRVKKLVKGRQATIIPEVVTNSELKLSSHLKLPLLGAGPRNMALLSSKSNSKKLCQLAEVPIGPWAVDIYDEDEFFTSLAGLVVKHPNVRTWLFKIDDERDSRGHAYIDLQKMREVVDALRVSVRAMSSSEQIAVQSQAEPAAVGTDAAEVRQLLRRHVPKRAMFCNRGVYPDFATWMAEAARVGAVIQAVPDTILSQTSVHIQIDPDGVVAVNGSTEAAMCTPFVRAASWYPHTRGSWEVLQETGLRMGRVLAAKGLVGYASIDVVFFENPEFDPQRLAEEDRESTPAVIGGETPVDPRELMFNNLRSPSPEMSETTADGQPPSSPQPPPSIPESRQADYDLAIQLQEMEPQRRERDPVSLMLGQGGQVGAAASSRFACWIVDVDARLTDEQAALWPLQFVAQVKQDTSTGHLRLTPDAPQPEGAAQMSEDELYEKSMRWAMISHVSTVPGMDRLNYQSLFQLAKMRGVSFDLFNNVGCVFTYLDVFHSLFSLLTVDKSAEGCAKRFATAAGVLAEGPSSTKGGARGKHAAAPSSLDLHDGLTVTDVQVALRNTLKRWSK